MIGCDSGHFSGDTGIDRDANMTGMCNKKCMSFIMQLISFNA